MKAIGIISTAALTLMLGIAAPIYAQQDEHQQQQEQKDKPAERQEKRAPEEQKKAQPDQRQPQQEQRAQEQKAQPEQRQTQRQPAQEEKARQNKPAPQEEQQRKDAGRVQPNERPAQQQEQRAKDNRPTQQNEDQAQQQRPAARPQRTQEQQHVVETAWQQHSSQRWDSDHRSWEQRGGYHGYRIPDNRFEGYFGPSHGFRIYGLPFLVVGGNPRFQYEGYWFSLVDPWPGYWANNWYDTDDVYVTYVNNGYYLFDQRYPDVAIAVSISL